jgi:branched-chain amino acid transport system permease protein
MMSGAYLTWTVMAIAGYAGLTLHPLVAMVPATLLVILLFLGTDKFF